jgi:hypothetical protein
MVWTIRITILLLLAWLAFMISPFVSLYNLGRAVEARDIEEITERVNFRALRVSITRQLVGEYLNSAAGKRDLGGIDRPMAMNAGSALLNPVVEQLITPAAVLDLLEDGWPEGAVTGSRPSQAQPMKLDVGSLGQAWRLFISSETQGFRSITIPYPDNVPKERQFRITLRLSGLGWRLTGVELPQDLRRDLSRRASRAAARAKD